MEIEDLKKLIQEQLTTEILYQMFESGKERAIENFVRGTWRGINNIDGNSAEIICKETCKCFESWMPPEFESIISDVYDKNNPDVDKALTLHSMIEKVAATPSGAEASIHRKGNIATLVTAQKGCICPFVAVYKIIDPTPNICSCPQNLFEFYFQKYYNLPMKCRVTESCNRGGNCCRYEMEFPEELIKTPEFEF